METIIAIANKEGVSFKVIHSDRFKEAIKCLSNGRYSIEVKKIYKQRSTQQNRARFGIAYTILKECLIDATGESISIDEVHEFCKERFLPSEYVEKLQKEHEERKLIVNENTGEAIELPFRLTSTKLNTFEEMEYYRNIQKFAAEFFSVEIPNPNEK